MYIFKVLNLAFISAHGTEAVADSNRQLSSGATKGMALCSFILAAMVILLCFNSEWILGILADSPSILAVERMWKP